MAGRDLYGGNSEGSRFTLRHGGESALAEWSADGAAAGEGEIVETMRQFWQTNQLQTLERYMLWLAREADPNGENVFTMEKGKYVELGGGGWPTHRVQGFYGQASWNDPGQGQPRRRRW